MRIDAYGENLRFQLDGDLFHVRDVAIRNRDQHGLNRRKPGREGPAVVLDQHAEEALQAAQQGAVNVRAKVHRIGTRHLQPIDHGVFVPEELRA